MSECSGPDCDHASHKLPEAPVARNPIITPYDAVRWPIMEMASSPCDSPLTEDDEQAIVYMDAILNQLGDTAAGLAAIQIGYPKRIFLLRKGETNEAYINPVVIEVSREMKNDGEACLSLPGMGAVFKRPKSITIEYRTIVGEIKRETFTGFNARCVCHEMDHLDGVLISKHLQNEVARQPRRTKFGMKLTPRRVKAIEKRRRNNKNARKERRRQRA
jgi:peptide deformylase